MDRAKLEEAIEAARRFFTDYGGTNALRATDLGRNGWEKLPLLIEAAETHLATLPKTKMVEVWRVEWAALAVDHWEANHRGEPTREAAEHFVLLLRRADTYDNTVRCIRVTGPHQQEVPAT